MANTPTRFALTLIELLCVITIIALLVAMLMPLAGMVRASARQVLCASNLRQVGLLELAYATNHAGTLTPAYLPRTWTGWLLGPLATAASKLRSTASTVACGATVGKHGISG